MLFVTAASLLLRLRGRLHNARWFHRLMTIVMPIGVMAIICGWIVSETGRQPWVVYGKLMTANAVSALSPAEVQLTLWPLSSSTWSCLLSTSDTLCVLCALGQKMEHNHPSHNKRQVTSPCPLEMEIVESLLLCLGNSSA